MATRQVVVYLDTSDISRFADIGTSHERGTPCERACIRETYEFLERHVEQGNIQVRFSGLHIAEIAKPALQDPPLQEPATRKAQVMERLCGSLCFRPFEEIWAGEIWQRIGSRAANERFTMPYEVYSDQGIWLFKSTEKLNLDLEAIIKNAMQGSVAGNRKERRALESQSRRGLRLYSPEAARAIASKFPVNDPQELVDIFVQRLSRRTTDAAVEEKLAEILLRPTQIIRFAFEMDKLRTKCPDVVVSIGERFVRAIADLRAKLAEVSDSVKNDFSRYVPATLLRRPALEAALRSRRHIRGLRISDEQIGEIVHDAPYGAFQAVDLISRATQIYAAQHANDPRKTRYSDGADLLHLTYLPYCDVFRADVYTADVLRQCDPLATAKVARRLEDLSALIERCLAASPGPTTAPGTSRASEATGSGIRVGPSVS